MYRILVLSVMVATACAKAPAPVAAATPIPDALPAPPAIDRSSVTFAFRPPVGTSETVSVVENRRLDADGQLRGTRITRTEQMEIQPADAGYRYVATRTAYEDDTLGAAGPQELATLESLRAADSERTQWLIGADGIQLTLDGDGWRPMGASLVEEGVVPDMAAAERILQYGMQQQWNKSVAFWLGGEGIPFGDVYQVHTTVAVLGLGVVDGLVAFGLNQWTPCHFLDAEVACVEAVVQRIPDSDAMQARLDLSRAGAALPTRLDVLNVTQVILDPATVRVWWADHLEVHRADMVPGGIVETTSRRQEMESRNGRSRQLPPEGQTLRSARAAHPTNLVQTSEPAPEPAAPPEGAGLALTHFDAPVGSLPAYVSPDPEDGERHPAIVWLTGGDTSVLGDVWSPADVSNDQSARAYRDAGVITMYPSQRGGHGVGEREGFLGEADDVLAAIAHVASLPYVDPDRIYLGGHSTGGTLALLVAASEAPVAGVVAFGAVASVADYGGDFMYADPLVREEFVLRSPRYWLHTIEVPTWIIEGEAGNAMQLMALDAWTTAPHIRFASLGGHDHFSVLAGVNQYLAERVAAGDSWEGITPADLQSAADFETP